MGANIPWDRRCLILAPYDADVDDIIRDFGSWSVEGFHSRMAFVRGGSGTFYVRFLL